MTTTVAPATGTLRTEAAVASRSRAIRRRRYRLLAVEIAFPILLVVAIAAWTMFSGIYFFPPLTNVLRAFQENWLFDRMMIDVIPSLARMGIGYAAAVIVGALAGLWLGQAPRMQAILRPVLEFLRAIPAVAIIPLIIIVLGIDDTAKVLLIAFICLWPVLLNTEAAVRGMDPGLRETARVYGIRWSAYQSHVVLPAAAPQIFAGMRTSLSFALIMVVVSEMVAGGNGLGFFVLQAQRSFAITDMWSGIILIGLLGYLMNIVLVLIENQVLAWHRGANRVAD